MMKHAKATLALFMFTLSLSLSANLWANEQYQIDSKGMHASIMFKIKHLGYSWLTGRFNDFNGNFTFDKKNPQKSSVHVTINTATLDTNHAERDKHLRGDEFFNVAKFPQAVFKSSKVVVAKNEKTKIHGLLTLHGVSKNIIITANEIGAGKDPWGGFRRGFEGKVTLSLSDFGFNFNLGPASKEVELSLYIEGIKQ